MLEAMTMARNGLALPEFLRVPILGEQVSARLADLADEMERQATEEGKSRVRAADIRATRRAASEIDRYLSTVGEAGA